MILYHEYLFMQVKHVLFNKFIKAMNPSAARHLSADD